MMHPNNLCDPLTFQVMSQFVGLNEMFQNRFVHYIYIPLRMNYNDFGFHFAFSLMLPSATFVHYLNKCL